MPSQGRKYVKSWEAEKQRVMAAMEEANDVQVAFSVQSLEMEMEDGGDGEEDALDLTVEDEQTIGMGDTVPE